MPWPALWMLYHVAAPVLVLQETARVLKPGGSFVACAPSRYNDPEFKAVLPEWGSRSTFDAEDAAKVIGQVFDVVDVERWDIPLVSLRDGAAVEKFLRGRGLSPQAAGEAATSLSAVAKGELSIPLVDDQVDLGLLLAHREPRPWVIRPGQHSDDPADDHDW